MRINFKNFGLLEALVLLSLAYVVGMLIWTASTRPAVEAKANLVKENHKTVSYTHLTLPTTPYV